MNKKVLFFALAALLMIGQVKPVGILSQVMEDFVSPKTARSIGKILAPLAFVAGYQNFANKIEKSIKTGNKPSQKRYAKFNDNVFVKGIKNVVKFGAPLAIGAFLDTKIAKQNSYGLLSGFLASYCQLLATL